MHLHTGRTMDGPWIKTVPVVYHILDVSFSTGLGIEGCRTCWKDELGNHSLGMKIKICSNWEFWGLNNKPSTSCHWFLCLGTWPRHQTRAPCLGPPRLMKGKSNFFTNHNILHTLKKEPLNKMLLHTSRTMDGPWIKTVPVSPVFLTYLLPRGSESRALWPVGKMNKETTP